MSREHVELVRAGYEAWQRGDMEAMRAFVSPDAVVHRAPPQPAGTWHGQDGVLLALHLHQRAVGRASGARVEGDFWLLHEIDGGLVVRTDIFNREEPALAAARRHP